jgi:ribonuclease HI
MKYYTDGSSTIGVKSEHCVVDEMGNILVRAMSQNPARTNNEEEYLGVIDALEWCLEGDEIYTDSLLVVNQVNGLYKVKKDSLKILCKKVKKLLEEKKATLCWIDRNKNLAGKVFE